MRELIRRKSQEFRKRLRRRSLEKSNTQEIVEDSSSIEILSNLSLAPISQECEISEDLEHLHNNELQELLLPSPLSQTEKIPTVDIHIHYSGIPASRLLLHPYQRILFKAQLDQHRHKDAFEESFYHQWNVFGVNFNKELRLEMVIETKYELRLFHQNLTAKKVHVFRDGVFPKKQDLDTGFTIVIKVEGESEALQLFSSITYPILSNVVYDCENNLQGM